MIKKSERLNQLVGLKIKYYRTAIGMDQSDLGDALGMSRGAITQMELGSQTVTLPTIMAFCVVFDCTPNDLIPAKKEFQMELEKYQKPEGQK